MRETDFGVIPGSFLEATDFQGCSMIPEPGSLVRSQYQKHPDCCAASMSRRVFPHKALNPACSEQPCIEEDSLAFKSSR